MAITTTAAIVLNGGLDGIVGSPASMIFGMYNSCAVSGSDGYLNGADTSTNWKAIRDAYMDTTRVKVRRSFNSAMPSNISSTPAATDAANGIVTFMSVKPSDGNPTTVTSGGNDSQITSLAASLPSGSYLTCFHEPENDMAGTTFVPMFQHFYTVAKSANPNILIGPVYMTYQWTSGMSSTTTPDNWWVGSSYCDFMATDTYVMDYQTPQSMQYDPAHQRWHNWAKTKSKPLIITETSVQFNSANTGYVGNYRDTTRGTVIGASLDWLASTGLYKMVLFWNSYHADGGVKDFEITPTTSIPGGSPQALTAWNTAVTTYGTTSTTDVRSL